MEYYEIQYRFHDHGGEKWLTCEWGSEQPGWTAEDRLDAAKRMSPGVEHRIRRFEM